MKLIERAEELISNNEVREASENALRLVEIIDRAETVKKVQYLTNVSRCVLADLIDRETYFRICHALTHTLEEDLDYLRQHIHEDYHTYGVSVQGLLISGLMFQCVIGGDDEQKYSFTPLARLVDRYAVGYDGTGLCQEPVEDFEAPKPKLAGVMEFETVSIIDDE